MFIEDGFPKIVHGFLQQPKPTQVVNHRRRRIAILPAAIAIRSPATSSALLAVKIGCQDVKDRLRKELLLCTQMGCRSSVIHPDDRAGIEREIVQTRRPNKD
jgi:hypothetical protein